LHAPPNSETPSENAETLPSDAGAPVRYCALQSLRKTRIVRRVAKPQISNIRIFVRESTLFFEKTLLVGLPSGKKLNSIPHNLLEPDETSSKALSAGRLYRSLNLAS
jgi:hypothetical protein